MYLSVGLLAKMAMVICSTILIGAEIHIFARKVQTFASDIRKTSFLFLIQARYHGKRARKRKPQLKRKR